MFKSNCFTVTFHKPLNYLCLLKENLALSLRSTYDQRSLISKTTCTASYSEQYGIYGRHILCWPALKHVLNTNLWLNINHSRKLFQSLDFAGFADNSTIECIKYFAISFSVSYCSRLVDQGTQELFESLGRSF